MCTYLGHFVICNSISSLMFVTAMDVCGNKNFSICFVKLIVSFTVHIQFRMYGTVVCVLTSLGLVD